MKLIVGLGNPGAEYEGTRHNAGFMVVEAVAFQFSMFNFQFSNKLQAEIAVSGEIILVKPQTFMNRSGEAVRKIVDYFKVELEEVLVVHDDLDICLGEYKISQRGPKDHNGLNSVRQYLGSDEFLKVRIGVDNRKNEERRIPGEAYVLSKFDRVEIEVMEEVNNQVVNELRQRLKE